MEAARKEGGRDSSSWPPGARAIVPLPCVPLPPPRGIAATVSNLLDLLAHYDGVLLADFLGRLRLVVVRTLVFVRVAVKAAEQVSAATLKSGEADFLPAGVAAVLLLLPGLVSAVWRTLGAIQVREGARAEVGGGGGGHRLVGGDHVLPVGHQGHGRHAGTDG